ncbi:MAG: GNAT family N-acetyltransferase [Lachnospiraceae bacterium]|nr:GNAT family N-acetyltransferase [Lachnospiraceae bacterium]
MRIGNVTAENIRFFQPLLPDYIIRQCRQIFGCIKDGEICGVAACEQADEHYSLSWLWVVKEKRRQGVGSALLDYICKKAAGSIVEVHYPLEEEWCSILDYMLSKRSFELRVEKLPCIRLTRQQIRESALLNELVSKNSYQMNVQSLNRIPDFRFRELKRVCEQSGIYLVSRADFEGADQQLSMVLMDEEKISGVLLLHRCAQPRTWQLSLFYLAKSSLIWGVPFLQKAAERALAEPFSLQALEIACVNDRSLRLAERLVGNGTIYTELVSHGIRFLK